MKKVYLSIISRHSPMWGAVTSMQVNASTALSELGVGVMLAPYIGDSLVNRARDAVLAKFLQTDCDYLFTVDDDIELPPYALVKLIRADKDIIGGFYRLKRDDGKVAARGVQAFDINDYRDKLEDEQIIEMEYLSTGCILHKREAIQKLWDAYPELRYLANEVPEGENERRALYTPFIRNLELLSEDWAFCKRARDKGIKLYGHAGVLCGHWGITNYSF